MPASGAAGERGIGGDEVQGGRGRRLTGGWRGGGRPAPAPAGPDAMNFPGSRSMLEVQDLRVHFATDDGLVKSVDGISFSLERGKTLGIVGESGSGKSVTSLAIMGLHYGTNADIDGRIWLDGEELVNADPGRVRHLRGSKMAMIFQDPLSSLHPYYTVGTQIIEAYLIHNKVGKKAAREHAIEMLNRVGIPQAASRVDDYPHQFSGGMRQRAMIAMALSCDPELLIADEPTTALDVTVQAQILVLVMYGGKAVEYGTAEDIFDRAGHPYTWGLLGSMPRLDRERAERLTPIKGTPPSLIRVPPGCAFHPRCAYADRTGGRSTSEVPLLRELDPGHLIACHLTADQRVEIGETEFHGESRRAGITREEA
jgi:peptide/nickel transport system ATP-binding protein